MRQLSCKLAAAVILATLPTIVIGEGVDPAKMGAYAGAAVPLLLKAGGELLFVTDEGQTEVIEGAAFPGSVRVLRFPSLQAAPE